MRTTASSPRHPRRVAPVIVLVVALLVGACDSGVVETSSPAATTATPAGSAGATPSPTGPPTTPASSPSGTSTPSPSPSVEPAPGDLAPGVVAVTVTSDLRVRSKPGVSNASVMYRPLLPAGTQLVVTGGPVAASGYTWFRVIPLGITLSGGVDEGWVAIADHDGTPWVAIATDPTPGFELVSAPMPRPAATVADARAVARGFNTFGLSLFGRMVDGSTGPARNTVMSTASVALALTMARAGARGDTAAQLDDLLHVPGWDALAGGVGSLQQLLAGRDTSWRDWDGVDHALSLRIANGAFAQDGWPIVPDYLDRIGQVLDAGLGLVDFVNDTESARQAINGWVARQTANRIPELLGASDVSSFTRLVLVNAMYLKAQWEVEFSPDATKPRAFTTPDGTQRQVPTMSLYGGQTVPYASGHGWQATELRYLGDGGSTPLAMTLILPDDLARFERNLGSSRLSSIVDALDAERDRLTKVSYDAPGDELDCGTYPYAVRLYLPKLSINTRADLKPTLTAMGMVAAGDSELADFGGITDPSSVAIGKVIHQANIDVDEKGTEAAAATAVVGDTTGGCGGPQAKRVVTLRLNQPFLFVLRDVQTGAILFLGQVVDPSAAG
jgi:serine protease inhibitor